MNCFDLIGPVMIGPSSSHTAGAARLGKIARLLLDAPPVRAEVTLSGSFARTYRGHGTDRALIAGILGMEPDDPRLPASLELARQSGLEFRFLCRDLPDAHPNTAVITLEGARGARITMQGASVGGGAILVTRLNGLEVRIDGETSVLVVVHQDTPGIVSAVANCLLERGLNICNLYLTREGKGGTAVMTVGVDGAPDQTAVERIKGLEHIRACIALPVA